MSMVLEIVVAAILVMGGLFGVIGSWGLLRLKDPMQRLHAPTKATTLGVGAALIALAVEIWLVQGRFPWREALVVLFFFVTAPLSALFLAKVNLFLAVDRKTLPAPGTGVDWATFTPDAEMLSKDRTGA